MKKTILILTILLIIPIAMAQETEVSEGVQPDSPFYGFDILIEKLQIILEPDKIKKIELRLRNVEERVEEIKIMANKNRIKAIELAEDEKDIEENKIIEEVEGMPEEIREKVLTNLQKHITVLKNLRLRIPEEAKEGIDNAIEKGERNIERFRERIRGV